MTSLMYYPVFVVLFALLKLCTLYFPYFVNGLYMPNEELGSFLVDPGFPTDSSPLEHVQRLVSLLNQTRVNNPVYVDLLFGVNFIHRHMVPPMNWELVMSFLARELGIFFTYKHLAIISHEFYMNAIAGAMYGPWWGAIVCCLLASISAALWFGLNWLLMRVLDWYYRLQARVHRNNLDGIEPVLGELVNAQPTNPPQEQGWPEYRWWTRALLRLQLAIMFALVRSVFPYPSWAFNMIAPIFLERLFSYELYWVLFLAWISGAALGQLSYVWYSAALVGTRLHQLDTIDGALNNWFCYLTTFCSVTFALGFLNYRRAIRG